MLKIRPFRFEDLEAVRLFTDREIGAGYYSKTELETIFRRSQKDGHICSLLLENEQGEIKGVRITYPPGQWEHGKGKGLHPEKWPHPLSQTAYFQSLFLAADLQGQGWGGKLSREAIRILRQIGTKGIVCHSWKESPNNSSTRYLEKLNFKVIAEHREYWSDIDYQCSGCLKNPCTCTAQEMYLNLEG